MLLKLAADGRLLGMTPLGIETGGRSCKLSFQLQLFARSGASWKAFDGSSGFWADDSFLSLEASLVRRDRWRALIREQRRGFAPLCPDLARGSS